MTQVTESKPTTEEALWREYETTYVEYEGRKRAWDVAYAAEQKTYREMQRAQVVAEAAYDAWRKAVEARRP
jgi:hypothetical protein